MSRPVKVAIASCNADLLPAFVERFAGIAPETELYVISEFSPPAGRWIPYRVDRPILENFERAKAALGGRAIQYLAVVLQPKAPYFRMRLLPWLFAAPHRTLFYNHNLDHFMLRPHGAPALARHFAWRLREHVVFQTHPGGDLYTWLWRLRHPRELRRPLNYVSARLAGSLPGGTSSPELQPAEAQLPVGISVVIPSRNGRPLLERLLPLVVPEVAETIVSDNGSDDGTADWLRSAYPSVRIEHSPEPLSFAQAVNRGIAIARYSHTCLLNNDMIPEPGFFAALLRKFDEVPDLFCATAQIFFPPGKRREETGKAVMCRPARHRKTTEFPVHCTEPLPGEDGSYVLYGSGGCSLYDSRKLRALGGVDEAYIPAYVEDLDLGVRGWQQGWPTVFTAGARTVHEHRTTTSRYYKEEDLRRTLERNYLLFLARTIRSPRVFAELWRDAVVRLDRMAALEHDAAARDVLGEAWSIARRARTAAPDRAGDDLILALGSGDVAVFPGRAARHESTVLVATCYIPFPLSHGGAVRMYNLMRRACATHSQVLVTFVDELHTPPAELLDICVEIVQVRRLGSHVRPDTGRPDVVEEFDVPAFRAALRQTIRKWSPQIAQLEFTQMAQYASDCRPAKTLLVEHDVTIDLYRQLLAQGEDWELRRQLARWERFETKAWTEVDCVVTMSERDRKSIHGAHRVETLANGVDLQRFQPSSREPDRARLLFIGSFAHLPNLLALNFFLTEVWPHLAAYDPVLHVIAGSRHEYFYNRAQDRLNFALDMPGLELEGFVADVRPAYERASVVIAPLLASAGTNIKIMEAMAMGKAIVSTTGGVNGLDELTPGEDVLVENDPANMAAAIARMLENPEARCRLERNARAKAERVYDWDRIAARQAELYRQMVMPTCQSP